MTVAVAFLQPGWADWEAGAVLTLLREHLKVQIEIATPTGDPETSIGGILAAADYRFDDPVLSDADLFILIGSDAWSEGEAPAITALLRQAFADGKPVAGICAGTTALARGGLFEGRKHTSNGKDWLQGVVPGYAGADHYVDTPKAVVDGKVVSASGLAPVTFAAAVARLVAPEAEAMIAEYEAMFAREFS
ncbi:type 1 glutamine amidotransferase family protein [Caulobacter sp. BP25]|uniref:type 1 glutamine amidotransferase family protein n=1 Tax=Caulobacter sp. BP25 TaxID=2048900 RepID=UPI000C129BD4|nr:type 1 glutamine amidotransferase family protein [Caulobacter sp. BP25]PHY17463.1 glutamine amidotransferase [Caulobacter sp. BP25]